MIHYLDISSIIEHSVEAAEVASTTRAIAVYSRVHCPPSHELISIQVVISQAPNSQYSPALLSHAVPLGRSWLCGSPGAVDCGRGIAFYWVILEAFTDSSRGAFLSHARCCQYIVPRISGRASKTAGLAYHGAAISSRLTSRAEVADSCILMNFAYVQMS